MVALVPTTTDSLGRLGPGFLSSVSSSLCPKERRWFISINPQSAQPGLIGQRVLVSHKEQGVGVNRCWNPTQRSPALHSERLKFQPTSDLQNLGGFFLKESSRRIRHTSAYLPPNPESMSPHHFIFSLVSTRMSSPFCLILQLA